MDCIPVSLVPVPPFSEDKKLIENYLKLYLISEKTEYLSAVHSVFFRQNFKGRLSTKDTQDLLLLLIDAICIPECSPTHRILLLLHIFHLLKYELILVIFGKLLFCKYSSISFSILQLLEALMSSITFYFLIMY